MTERSLAQDLDARDKIFVERQHPGVEAVELIANRLFQPLESAVHSVEPAVHSVDPTPVINSTLAVL